MKMRNTKARKRWVGIMCFAGASMATWATDACAQGQASARPDATGLGQDPAD